MSKPTYAIKHWPERYEFGDYKKCRKAEWYPKRTKFDGRSYKRLMRDKKSGPMTYLAWTLLECIASKMPKRGILADENGPLDSSDFELMTDVPAKYFDDALNTLLEIGWLQILGTVPNDSEELGQTPPTEQDKTGQDRTVQDKTEQHTGDSDSRRNAPEVLPSVLDTPEFRDAWARWKEYRKEIRHKLTKSTTEKQLKALARLGHDAAIAAIERSITNGWRGLVFKDKDGRKPEPERYRITKDADDPDVQDLLAEMRAEEESKVD